MLGEMLGKVIKPNEIQRGLGEAFGPNASAMAQTAMKVSWLCTCFLSYKEWYIYICKSMSSYKKLTRLLDP